MSKYDDMTPADVMYDVLEVLTTQIEILEQNVMSDDDIETQAVQWAVLGSCLRKIKMVATEGVKAVQRGSDDTAAIAIDSSRHVTLDKFADAKEVDSPKRHEQ